MPAENYSYLDLTVMPFARRKVISADAAIVFDEGISRILWANAAGTELFASGLVVDLISSSISHSHPLVSQIINAAAQIFDEEPVVRSFRIVQGLKTLSLKGTVRREILPDGSKAFLLAISNWTSSQRLSEHLLAESAVNSLEGFADASAIVDEYGLPIASSSQFDEMDVLPANLQNLVKETSSETDRMVKRQLKNEAGLNIAAGIGRIHDLPARYIVVLAMLEENTKPDTPPKEQSIASSLPHGEPEQVPDVSPPWKIETPSDALHSDELEVDKNETSLLDRWYFKENAVDEARNAPNREIEPEEQPVLNEKPVTENITPNDLEEDKKIHSGENPIRFAFSIGPDQIFRTVSPELEQIVGRKAADIVGRHWTDIASQFGFDETGAISKLLDKADTWSGKSVFWPVENTDMSMPIDLAALPIFDRERTFDGFRGFGIIRTADTVVDPDAKGMHLDERRNQVLDRNIGSIDEAEWADNPEIRSTKSSEHFEVESESSSHKLGWKTEVSDIDDKKSSNIVSLHGSSDAADCFIKPELSGKDANVLDDIRKRLEDEGVEVRASDELQSRDNVAHIYANTETSILSRFDSPVLIYNSDKALFANQELLQLAGYKSVEELSEFGGVERLLDDGEQSSDGTELNLRRKDGSFVSVRPTLKRVEWDGAKALCLSFEKVENISRKNVDISAGKNNALDMVRISDLENILDTATDGILVLEKDGTIEALNASGEALFDKAQADVIGLSFLDMFAKESRESLNSYFSDLNDPNQSSLLNDGREVIGIETSGGMIPMFVTIGGIGEAGKFCMILRDLTELKKSEEELVTAKRSAEAASEQKSEFLARISHEIREPLNAIIGFSDIMIEERFGAVDNERYSEYLKDINRSGVHVLDLVNDLLDISKIEAGKIDLSYEAVDLNQLAAETVALLQPKANSRRIIIRTSLSRAVPKVVADARSIRQIVMNLASNAIHHSPPNSQVIVSTTFEANGEVGLRVRDTGNGMNQKQLETALEPFSQVNDSNLSVNSGTGLGLPLTKALVEANRAYFELESTVGEGTIAYVQFPTQRVLAD